MRFFRRFSREDFCRELRTACDATREEALPDAGQFFWLEQLTDAGIEVWERTWKPLAAQAPPLGGWDWGGIHLMHANSDRAFCVSLWATNHVLCGLALLRLSQSAVKIEIIEGNPDHSHPLKKSVLPIMLDVAARFAQRLGKRQIHAIDPHERMIEILTSDFEFEVVKERNGRHWCRREV